MSFPTSNCCNAPIRIEYDGALENTEPYKTVCTKCGKECGVFSGDDEFAGPYKGK